MNDPKRGIGMLDVKSVSSLTATDRQPTKGKFTIIERSLE
jgi:hypothetical protein